MTTGFLDDHGIAVVVYGDDITPDVNEEVFGPVAAAGRVRGVSTTDLIRRCLARGIPA